MEQVGSVAYRLGETPVMRQRTVRCYRNVTACWQVARAVLPEPAYTEIAISRGW